MFILNNGIPVEVSPDIFAEWSKDHSNRRVAYTEVGALRISTVFLGINHGFGGKPLWFETMVFVGNDFSNEVYCDRYETIEEAREGHRKTVIEYSKADDCTGDYLRCIVLLSHI